MNTVQLFNYVDSNQTDGLFFTGYDDLNSVDCCHLGGVSKMSAKQLTTLKTSRNYYEEFSFDYMLTSIFFLLMLQVDQTVEAKKYVYLVLSEMVDSSFGSRTTPSTGGCGRLTKNWAASPTARSLRLSVVCLPSYQQTLSFSSKK